jgi:hypothetical protein
MKMGVLKGAAVCLLSAHIALAVPCAFGAEGAPANIRLLGGSPSCVERRLGVVSVTLGSREPNPRSGMPPPGVSYRTAFARLIEAAESKGANAVVLRAHEAAYIAKGARRPKRPTYLSLQGAAVRLDDKVRGCVLDVIEADEFERRAAEKERDNMTRNTGVSF